MANEKHIEIIRTVAYIAWKAAANAFRLYPDGKHTFSEYWATAKIQFNEELELLQSEHDREIQKIIDQNVKLFNDKDETIRQLTQEVERLKIDNKELDERNNLLENTAFESAFYENELRELKLWINKTTPYNICDDCNLKWMGSNPCLQCNPKQEF